MTFSFYFRHLLMFGSVIGFLPQSEPSSNIVTLNYVDQSQVRGHSELSMSGKEFYSFTGIPFAKPPVGKLRFKDPVPVEPWQGVRNASINPPPCIQPSIGASPDQDVMGSEDCLYLNVFTSKPNNQTVSLPVMVFIHGGAFKFGMAAGYAPKVLMDEDIVLVVIQYRLGALGFLSTEDSVIPGNYGLKDQTLALHWIQEHIVQFGGDRDRVTIFGNSAGSASCNFHMFSPLSKGLFHRAILQSGTALAPWARSSNHKNFALKLGKVLGCNYIETSEEIRQCLMKADAGDITSGTIRFQKIPNYGPNVFLPRIDGDFLTEDIELLLRNSDIQTTVDVMAGINRDEGGLSTTIIVPRHEALIRDNLKDYSPHLLFTHDEKEGETIAQKIIQYFLKDKTFGTNSVNEIAKMLSVVLITYSHDLSTSYSLHHNQNNGKKLFLYEFNHPSNASFCNLFPVPYPTSQWVAHADELLYLFDFQTMNMSLSSDEDLKLRADMIKLWTNFAAIGNPTPDASLGFKWEESNLTNFQHLSLVADQPFMKQDNRQKNREFMSSLPLKQNKLLNAKDVISSLKSNKIEL